MSDDADTPLYSKRQMSEAIQRRLKDARSSAMPDEVQRELLRSILERLDAIEARLERR